MFLPCDVYSRQVPNLYFPSCVSRISCGGFGGPAAAVDPGVPGVFLFGVLAPLPPEFIHEYCFPFFRPPNPPMSVLSVWFALAVLEASASRAAAEFFFSSFLDGALDSVSGATEPGVPGAMDPERDPEAGSGLRRFCRFFSLISSDFRSPSPESLMALLSGLARLVLVLLLCALATSKEPGLEN